MLMIVLAFFVLCISSTFCADHNGWEYLVSQSKSNWNEAKSKCQSQNGDFWKPTANILDWVSSFIKGEFHWISAHDQDEEGSWMWSDGSIVQAGESKWLPGQPDNNGGAEHCVNTNGVGWNDDRCDANFKFVCQWPLCGGLTVKNGACRVILKNDAVYYRGGSARYHGGGTCESPENCIDCRDGFYANQGCCTTFCEEENYNEVPN